MSMLESALGVVVEFVVMVFSVVRHVDINLARHSRTGVVSSARTSARRSAKKGASDAPYLGPCLGRVDFQKRFRMPWEATDRDQPRRGISLDPLPYPRAQCVRDARDAFLPSEAKPSEKT